MLKCTINGKQLEVAKGTTIIEAFKLAGIEIAHYCWHPALSTAGVCRMCMVSIEGNPKNQLACNTPVMDGMIISNETPLAKESVKWVLDFHLINHPLDCPICDQAGECGLQNQYMKFGCYTPEMSVAKVKKKKVVDLGPRVVLDSERCILCSRCVRFTSEITKTNELGIFNRGDHSEIGTFNDRPLNNNYSLNTVDICPVGALTSKDFRFKQRVWFLSEYKFVCPGCSTGCNTKVSYNTSGIYRIKPELNEKINGYWMCDEGRDLYKKTDKIHRLIKPKKQSENGFKEIELTEALEEMKLAFSDLNSSALILTGQYTNEEYDSFLEHFKQVFYWVNQADQFDQFDGLLLRGDRNPNSVGLLQRLEGKKYNFPWSDLLSQLSEGKIKNVLVAGPEFQEFYPDLPEKLFELNHSKKIFWLTVHPLNDVEHPGFFQIPVKSFFEKKGAIVNYQGIEQKIDSPLSLVPEALEIKTIMNYIKGNSTSLNKESIQEAILIENQFIGRGF